MRLHANSLNLLPSATCIIALALLYHLVCLPACSYLFWTEWGQYPRIERSRLDGTQRLVLVNVSISWPNGISIDYEVWTTAS